MIIGGLQKNSLLDYPGKISAIIFTQGCNFRCHFCYNPMLVWPIKSDKNKDKPCAKGQEKDQFRLDEADLFHFLKKRAGKIDAVVISGGEPTIHSDLPKFIDRIKKIGYLIKLDTNGTNPEMLLKLMRGGLLDYIAMDIKTSFEKYEKAVGIKCDLKKIEKSVKLIMASNLKYEFRTTLAPGLVDSDDLLEISQIIKGADQWFLQKFRPEKNILNPEFDFARPYSDSDIKKVSRRVGPYVKKCGIR
jgi:pyruvate formate lyase activating enzyme